MRKWQHQQQIKKKQNKLRKLRKSLNHKYFLNPSSSQIQAKLDLANALTQEIKVSKELQNKLDERNKRNNIENLSGNESHGDIDEYYKTQVEE